MIDSERRFVPTRVSNLARVAGHPQDVAITEGVEPTGQGDA